MMDKKAQHHVDLASLLEAYMAGAGREELEGYIRSHSRLPGPRGNLEMAHAFADTVAASAGRDSGKLWGLLCALAAVTAVEAPVNHPGELLPFCGAVGMGALAASDTKFRPAALEKLRALPAQGFAFLHKLAALEDSDVLWILRNNLKKARLIRAHPEETEALLQSLR